MIFRFVKRFSNTYGILVTAFFALSTIAICTALLSLNEVEILSLLLSISRFFIKIHPFSTSKFTGRKST